MIRLDDVHVDLDHTAIVKGVSTAIGTGDWLALLGPNGAGKTTVLRAIAGLVRYRGTITVDGGTPKSKARARTVAYVPQTPILPPDMTVHDYVLLGRTPHLRYLAGPGKPDHVAVTAAIDRLDVAEFIKRRLGSLSGGEVQRVVLARALAQEPRIILLDEPTSALDIGHQQHVLELIDELRRTDGLTVVSTLHDLTTAGQYAHQLVLLDHGKVVAQGTAADVLTAERIAQVYAARVTIALDAAGHPAVTPVRSQLAVWPESILVRASSHGPVHRAGDAGAPHRTRPGEVLGSPGVRGGHADSVGCGAGTGESGFDEGLRLGFGRGDHRVHERGVGERHRDGDDDVDRADRVQLRVLVAVRCGGPGRHPQAHGGDHPHTPVVPQHVLGDLGGGEQAHARSGQAEPAAQLGEVRDRIHPAVTATDLSVKHPLARAEAAASHAAGDHPVARSRSPQQHRQPPALFLPPVHLR